MANMDDKKPEETTDFEANVIERQRNFLSRAAGAVSGAVTGILTGERLLKKSLRSYLQRGLFAREWQHGAVEDVIVGVANGHLDTMSGAIISREKQEEMKALRAKGLYEHLSGNGTLVGDEVMNEALQQLFQAHIKPHPNAEEAAKGKFVLKDGFLKTAVDKYSAEAKRLEQESREDLKKIEHKYFVAPAEVCRAELAKTAAALDEAKTADDRIKAVEAFDSKLHTDNNKIFKGSYLKFREEVQKVESNLRRNTNDLKQAIVDVPIYDEMMKTGKEPGRMGLRLRHAHDRGEIIAFSAGAAVAVGYIVEKSIRSYLRRNEKGKDNERSFQQGVVAGREAARHEQSSII